jgi:hypothetical protein
VNLIWKTSPDAAGMLVANWDANRRAGRVSPLIPRMNVRRRREECCHLMSDLTNPVASLPDGKVSRVAPTNCCPNDPANRSVNYRAAKAIRGVSHPVLKANRDGNRGVSHRAAKANRGGSQANRRPDDWTNHRMSRAGHRRDATSHYDRANRGANHLVLKVNQGGSRANRPDD